MDCSPPALIAEDKKTSMRCSNLLSLRIGEIAVMDVKSHIIAIDKDIIQDIISLDRDTPVPTKTALMTRITLKLVSLAPTTIPITQIRSAKSLCTT